MRENRADDPLNEMLRAGDPAAGDSGLSPPERAAMRRRVLAAGRDRVRQPQGWLLPAATATVLLALALGLASRSPRTRASAPVAESPRFALANQTSGHQIQFTTENGTLVVWVLQPSPTS